MTKNGIDAAAAAMAIAERLRGEIVSARDQLGSLGSSCDHALSATDCVRDAEALIVEAMEWLKGAEGSFGRGEVRS
jgi:hypothetical protein